MTDTADFTEASPERGSFGERPALYRAFQSVPETSHFALFYRGRQERLDAALAFVKLGLENGERCLYVADESTPAEVYDALETLGADSERVRDPDQFRVRSASEVYLDGGFDPAQTARGLVSRAEGSRADGYDGLRVTAETGWVHREDVPFERVVRFEAECERLLPTGGATALCQHDLRRLSDAAVVDLLKTQQKVVYRHRICENPYYCTPDQRQFGDEPSMEPEKLLETLYRLATANDAIERREQRVAVLNRVLRHNLRNEMNVVQSHAELLRDGVDPENRESVEAILSTTSRLMAIAEDAKRVEQSVSGIADRVPIDVVSALERAAERVRAHDLDLAVAVPTGESRWVEASDELEFALVELFQSLATVADAGACIRVTFDEERSTHARLCLRVRCRDARLPTAEIEALAQGRETQLTHGNGLGLWLVNWIVELSGGDLSFRQADSGVDEVLLSFISV